MLLKFFEGSSVEIINHGFPRRNGASMFYRFCYRAQFIQVFTVGAIQPK